MNRNDIFVMKTITINELRKDKALFFAEHYEQIQMKLNDIGASLDNYTITCDESKTTNVLSIINDILKIDISL